jgi:hypothetical protein
MKTTIELPDDLLIEAKAVAVRRRTTLKEMITHALRREIGSVSDPLARDAERLDVGPFGILRLKSRGEPVTDAMVRKMQHGADDEDFQRAVKASGKR